MMRWHDVTIPMRPEMVVWPGDPPFEFAQVQRIDTGGHVNLSRVAMGTHTGTHIDAPWHFCNDGHRLDQIQPEVFFGKALVLDLPELAVVGADDLGPDPLPARVLIKTRNSARPADHPFATDFVALDAGAARRMVDEGVRLVGVDSLSVAPYKQKGENTHVILLGNDIVAVEGLRLADVPAGECEFVVLPLLILGADGAPCRAFVGLEECL